MILPSFGLAPAPSTPDTVGRLMCSLSDAEKLIVYYGLNLYLLKDDDTALKIFEKYANDIKGSHLFEANVSRILALIKLRKGDNEGAIKEFEEAIEMFGKAKSLYGTALCKFGIAYIKKESHMFDALNLFEST